MSIPEFIICTKCGVHHTDFPDYCIKDYTDSNLNDLHRSKLSDSQKKFCSCCDLCRGKCIQGLEN